jgi:RHS repeat-associated protein
VWLEKTPLAQVQVTYASDGIGIANTQVIYLHTDNLNTPPLASSQSQQLLWSWNSDAFGVGAPNQDVDGDGVQTDIPLRFPGQIADAHSALYYNYFRDYDPETGRYVESDPIGLAGGLNTYGYVKGNPVKYTDPTGEILQGVAGAGTGTAVSVGVGVGIGSLYCALNPTHPSCEAARDILERCGDAISNAWGQFTESRPREGEPNSDYWPGEREDGSTGDGRRFGSDGKPEVDYDHSHGNHVGSDGEPLGDHAHNWDKQPDGSTKRGQPCRYCQIK